MKSPILILGLFCIATTYAQNNRPIIGVMTREVRPGTVFDGLGKSFIPGAYVKFVEGSGARVVPIPIDKTEIYYRNLLKNLNGVLFPGGSASLTINTGYAGAGNKILKIAKEFNDNGEYFPLWGTCLGFELLAVLSANQKNILEKCNADNVHYPLNFKPDFKTSKMFKNAPADVTNILTNQPVTANFHEFCVTEKGLKDNNLNDWRVVSLNKDTKGFEFVSIFESKKYPFYGVQFHPEKPMYEFSAKQNTNHGKDSITANRYFGDFFISEARKSNHKYSNQADEDKALIYNYKPTVTGDKSTYAITYFFNF